MGRSARSGCYLLLSVAPPGDSGGVKSFRPLAGPCVPVRFPARALGPGAARIAMPAGCARSARWGGGGWRAARCGCAAASGRGAGVASGSPRCSG